MSGGPKDASLSGEGFRFYRFAPDQSVENQAALRALGYNDAQCSETTDVLSVTSIRKLTGESYNLVAWQLNNLINAAMGMTQRIVIGPRGGKNKTYVLDGEFPGSFLRQMAAGEGRKAEMERIRQWLRDTADKPRDTAAVRGSIVHEAIELNADVSRIDQGYVESAVERLSVRDRKKVKNHGGVTQEDVDFIQQALGQYWDMRVNVPFVVLAREPQLFNLTVGYGGSADVLWWFLGHFATDGTFVPLPGVDMRALQKLADQGKISQSDIERIGGYVTLGDWKTSQDVHTDQTVQVHAYLAAEFIGSDGVVDQRLTDILRASRHAAIIHIRPEHWAVHLMDFVEAPLRAFLGSVAFARFMAQYKEPDTLFTHSIRGSVAIQGQGIRESASTSAL